MYTKRSLGLEMRTLANLILRQLNQMPSYKELGNLTGMHGWAIDYLLEHKDRDIFQKDFEQQFSIRRSTASRILQLMEKNGLVVRESVEGDARLKRIRPTDKAVRAHALMAQQALSLEEQLTTGISHQELDVFYSVLDKMKGNIQ